MEMVQVDEQRRRTILSDEESKGFQQIYTLAHLDLEKERDALKETESQGRNRILGDFRRELHQKVFVWKDIGTLLLTEESWRHGIERASLKKIDQLFKSISA
jgi:hypothetical protein